MKALIFFCVCRFLFRRKPIQDCLEERDNRGSEEGSGLAESLGLTDLLGYGIGCTVGAGIYSQISIGVAAAGNMDAGVHVVRQVHSGSESN